MGRSHLQVLILLIFLGGSLGHVDSAILGGNDVYAHIGDLIVAGNDTVTFENCTLIQNGNIYVRENGTLLLDNCDLVLNQSSMYQYNLEVHDNGRLFALNSSISSDYGFDQYYDGNSTVNFTNTVLEHATWTYASGQFLYMFNCSELGHLSVSTNATFDSCIGYSALLTSENANVQINNSQMGTAYIGVKDSTLNVTNLFGQPYRVDYFNTFSNLTVAGGAVANLTVFNSNVSFGFEAYNSSIAISDCYITGLEAYSTSNISIVDSVMSTIHAGESVNLSLNNVYLSSYVIAYDNSTIMSKDSHIYRLEASDQTFCSLNSSTVNDVSAYFSSTVYAVDSTLSTLSANQKSVFSLVNSTYTSAPSINNQATMLVSWYLDVHVTDSIGQNVSSANVTAYLEGVVIQSELTDADGLARLTLQGKMINATGVYPVADYFVNASYLAYRNATLVTMIGNMQITLTLEGFIVPEFPSTITLLLLISVALIVIIVARRKKQHCIHLLYP